MTQSDPPPSPYGPPSPPPPAYPPYGHYPPPPGAPPGMAPPPYAAMGYGYGMYGPGAPQPTSHSGIGIASLLLGILSVLGLVATVVVGVVMTANDPGALENENSPATLALGACALACLLLSLVGVGLGIGGLVQRDRKRVFAWIGLTLNAVILLLVVGLMVVGALSE